MLQRYDFLKAANEASLFSSDKFRAMGELMEELCSALAAKGVRWAVSMSFGLFLRGAHDHFNDFDLLIDPRDTAKFEAVFESLGGTINHETIQKPAFTSPYYKEAEMRGVKFDLIADITIETYGTVYRYELKEVEWFTLRHDLNIPVIPAEGQYILYYMMTAWEARRVFKTEITAAYLKAKGVKFPDVFKRALEGTELYSEKYGKETNWQLPEDLRLRIAGMLAEL
ncbi:MAG: hypothetical protein IKE91_07090 [Clostridia bacterium]|nr:hypothetical protein [Clostridia bacterium]